LWRLWRVNPSKYSIVGIRFDFDFFFHFGFEKYEMAIYPPHPPHPPLYSLYYYYFNK